MKKYVLLLVLLIVGIATSSAQAPKLPSSGMGKPKVFNESLLKESSLNAFLRSPNFTPVNLTDKPWVVYSDRDNNQTYMSPAPNSAKCTTLKFNETLRVAYVKNGFALVYVDPIQTKSLQISQEAVSKGWVPMSNLLLWNSALSNDQGIYYKALLCRSLDSEEQSSKKLPTTTCYFAPNKTAKSDEIPSDMNFYFIMKRQGNMVLLAKHSRISDLAASDKMLLGWLEQDTFAPWNQRSCAEPTWKHEDVEYFAEKDVKIKFYENKSLSGNPISDFKFAKKQYERRPRYIYRMKGNDLRYPILDDGNSKIYNLSTFKTFGNDSKNNGMSEADSIQLAVFKRQQQINLAIVIDGTKSMEKYYPAVKEAIKHGCNYFNTDKYTLKVGVVIYRDYADGESGLVEVLPLTRVSNIDRINDFLDSGGAYRIRSASGDKTEAEALYYGINTALDRLKFKKGESNMMLIVGDCGNDLADTKISRESLVRKMVEKEMHVMGFQVRNIGEREAYGNFNSQIIWLIRNTLLGNYKALTKGKEISINVERVSNSAGHNEGYDYKAETKRQLYLGNYRRALSSVNNGEMDPAKLTTHMTSAISTFATTIQDQIDLIAQKGKSMIFAVDPNNIDINVDIEFIKKRLGADYADKLKNSQVITFKGYTPKKSEDNREFFKPIIFIAESELSMLLKRMEPVYIAAINRDVKNRKPYFDAMKALVRSLAPGLSEEEMGALRNDEITKMIGGLNEAPASLKTQYRLDDLTNREVIPDDQYERIILDFKYKYDNLRHVFQDTRYQYKRTFGDIIYYWLPIDMLP